MKCHICGTQIPMDSNECPNCGNKVTRPHRIQSFFQTRTRNQKAVLLGIGMIVGLVVCAVAAQDISPRFNKTEELYGPMTYQEAIENGYDDGSIGAAVDYQEEVQTFLQKELSFINFDISQTFYHLKDEVSASFSLDGTYQDTRYSVYFTFRNKQLASSYLAMSGSTHQSIQSSSSLPADKKVVQVLSEYLGIENAYNVIDQERKHLKQDTDDLEYFYYLSQKSPYIHIEENKSDETTYNFHCMISSRPLYID